MKYYDLNSCPECGCDHSNLQKVIEYAPVDLTGLKGKERAQARNSVGEETFHSVRCPMTRNLVQYDVGTFSLTETPEPEPRTKGGS